MHGHAETDLIIADAVAFSRRGKSILRDINLTIQSGEIVTVVGPNGSGKTTLLRLIIGALQPTSGHIRRNSGLRIGYVPQKLMLQDSMPLTVGRFLNLPRRVLRADAERVLSSVGAETLWDRQFSRLSGGQLQRVLLARALLGNPDMLILDEPTTGLDQPGSAQFYQLIEEVARMNGCAVLMVSHELHVVMSASDRVVCLNGHICCAGSPEQVSSAPAYRQLFGSGTGGALALYRHDHHHSHD